MKKINLLHSEDAVSEVVDFVTILGLLVLSIGLIGVAGYPILKSAQEGGHIENTKQTFIVMAENINKVVMGQAPSQSVELKLYGGSLSVTGSSTINITAKKSTGEFFIVVNDTQMRSIESTIGDTVVAYEGTGVWAKYPNGNVLVVSKPLITNQSNVLVIPIVTLIGSSSIGGSGMNRVEVSGIPRLDVYKNVSDVQVTITGDYVKGWGNYFNHIMSWSICTEGVTSGECYALLDTEKNIDLYILNIQLNSNII